MSALEGYYRWHSQIYDLTRWAFLFGRVDLVRHAAKRLTPKRILEIGCGTGQNLRQLHRAFPDAEIVGVDLSPDMLAIARRKVPGVTLRQGAYLAPVGNGQPFDLILISYCLTMINPGHDAVLQTCLADLSADGQIAVVDFHSSGFSWFRRWMAVNHVRMEGQILAWFAASSLHVDSQLKSAYGGLWSWVECFARR